MEALLGASLGEVVVVLGSDADAVGGALTGLPVRLVTNPDYAAGMSTSVRTGVEALTAAADAAVIALGDQPGAGAAVVERLVARYRAGGAAIVAPVYRGGVRGNPVLFDRSVFDELRAITGDEGARSVIARVPGRVALVELDVETPADVDTRADLGACGFPLTP